MQTEVEKTDVITLALMEMLKKGHVAGDWFLNFTSCAPGNNILISGDAKTVNQFIDGSKITERSFEVRLLRGFSSEYGGWRQNMRCLDERDQLMNRVNLQNGRPHALFPEISYIHAHSKQPPVQQDENAASYSFTITIRTHCV